MRFKRKIAAALAAVMAFGSVGIMDLAARYYPVSEARSGIHGEWLGHGPAHQSNRLVDVNSVARNEAGHHGVDFVIVGSQLHHGWGEHQSLRLRITGDGIWNYGARGITNTAARPTQVSRLAPPSGHTPGEASLNNIPIPVLTTRFSNVNPAGTPVQPFGFWRDDQSANGGPGDTRTALDWIVQGPGVTYAWPVSTIRWANTSDTAYRVLPTNVAIFYSPFIPVAPGPGFDVWQPINPAGPYTAASWATALFGLNTTATGGSGQAAWMNAIASAFPGEGLVAGTNQNFFIVPISSSLAPLTLAGAVIRVPTDPINDTLDLIGTFVTSGYQAEYLGWTFDVNHVDRANQASMMFMPPPSLPLGMTPGSVGELILPDMSNPAFNALGVPLGVADFTGSTAAHDSIQIANVRQTIVPGNSVAQGWILTHNWDRMYRVGTPVAGHPHWRPITEVVTGGGFEYGIGSVANMAMLPTWGTVQNMAWLGSQVGTTWFPMQAFHPIVARGGTGPGAGPIPNVFTMEILWNNFIGPDTSALWGTPDDSGPFIRQHLINAGPMPAIASGPSWNQTIWARRDASAMDFNVAGNALSTFTLGTNVGHAYTTAVRVWPNAPITPVIPSIPPGFLVNMPPLTLPTDPAFDFVPILAAGADPTNHANWRLMVFRTGHGPGLNIAAGGPVFTDLGTAHDMVTSNIMSFGAPGISGQWYTGGFMSGTAPGSVWMNAARTIPATVASINAVGTGVQTNLNATLYLSPHFARPTEVSGHIVTGAYGISPGMWLYPTLVAGGLWFDTAFIGNLQRHTNVQDITGFLPWLPGGGTPGPDNRQIVEANSIGNNGTTTNRVTRIAYSGRITEGAAIRNEIPFRMNFMGANEVEITWTRADVEVFGGSAGAVLRIPMVVQATGNGEISVEIVAAGSTVTPSAVGGAVQPITGPPPILPTVALPRITVSRNTRVEIPVIIEHNPGLATFDIVVRYLPNIMTPVSVRFGDAATGFFTAYNVNFAQNGVLITGMGFNVPVSDGNLAYITFDISGAPDGEYPIEIDLRTFSSLSPMFAPVPINPVIRNGSVTIVTTLLGDVNGDGIINADDAMMVFLYLSGMITLTAQQRIAADVNQDGVIDMIDANMILAIAAGTFPPPGWLSAEIEEMDLGVEIQSPMMFMPFSSNIIRVPVGMQNNIGFSGFDLTLRYDNQRLIPVGFTQGNAWQDLIIFNPDAGYGYVKLIGASASNANMDGSIAYVIFEIIGDGDILIADYVELEIVGLVQTAGTDVIDMLGHAVADGFMIVFE